MSSIDMINGGKGIDTFKVSSDKALATTDLAQMTKVEILSVNGTNTVTLDTTSITDLTNLNVTKATTATLTAAAITNVNVSGASGAIDIAGGKNVIVNDKTAATAITVGEAGAGTTNAAGTITVIDTDNSGANAIKVDGGTDVTVTATTGVTATGDIVVGANKTATGNVVVTQNLNSDGVVAAIAADAIAVTGGKTVTVTQNANSTATIQTAANGITTSTVAVTADNATTDVTVKANDNVTQFTKDAVELVKATQDITFKALASGKTAVVNGLTFTAAKNLTAEEVAQAFANLTSTPADTQSEGGIVTNGTYTGSNTTVAATSGAANGATVTFTSTGAALTSLTVSSSDVANSTPTKGAVVAGTAFAAAVTSTNAVTMNTVVIDDNATKSIENITVDGATAVTLGDATVPKSLDALKTLSLANVSGATNLNTTAETLDLTLDNVTGATSLDVTLATIKTLNVTTANEDSKFALTAAAVKDLTVDGTNAFDAASSTLTALETVTVKDTAGLTIDASGANVTAVDTTATTGTVTATIDATKATYTGGAGVDNVTTSAVAPTKAIALGAGDDSVTLASGTTAMGTAGTINGGEGTDTLSMVAADAVTASLTTPFALAVTNFEKLTLTGATGTQSVDAAKLGSYNYVTVNSLTGANATTIAGLTSGATIALADATATIDASNDAFNDIIATITDAATSTTDVLNIAITANGIDGTADAQGSITAANVETINISVTDGVIQTPTNAAADSQTLTLVATSAKTINVSGDTALDLTNAGNVAVTTLDASAMTAGLTFISANTTTAATIKGGSGNDDFTIVSNNSVVTGGAGKDTLTVADGVNLVSLNGGEGKDTYEIGLVSNANGYATISGTAAELSGDVIKFAESGSVDAIGTFKAAAITLGSTAVFQDYVNEAAKGDGSTTNIASYFTWDGDTYLVKDNTAATSFVNGDDAIVKIAGVVDFTFNDTSKVLELA